VHNSYIFARQMQTQVVIDNKTLFSIIQVDKMSSVAEWSYSTSTCVYKKASRGTSVQGSCFHRTNAHPITVGHLIYIYMCRELISHAWGALPTCENHTHNMASRFFLEAKVISWQRVIHSVRLSSCQTITQFRVDLSLEGQSDISCSECYSSSLRTGWM